MKFVRRVLLLSLVVVAICGFSWPFSWMLARPNPLPVGSNAWLKKQIAIIQPDADDINPKVLRLSLIAYMKARKEGLDKRGLLTVVDYSLPSTEKRMWVFDLRNGRTLFHTWVSHGKNSGGVNADSFSNRPGSLKSSLGVFVTSSDPYFGHEGYSLRLHGLEPGINSNAYDRDIVVHGAWYVDADTIRKYGQIGRSWGCFAVNDRLAKSIIDTIKQNTVIFAYYPDRSWLNHSKFLEG